MKSSTSNLKWAIVVTVLVIFGCLGMRWWSRFEAESRENACIYNLGGIDAVKHQWAQETGVPESSDVTPTWEILAPYLSNINEFWEGEVDKRVGFRMPKYPPNATYTIGPMSDSPTCSYSGHTFALYGLRIHVQDSAVPIGDGQVFEIYVRPGDRDLHRRMRPAGSLEGATVCVFFKTTSQTNLMTGEDGAAWLKFSSEPHDTERFPKPVGFVVSKPGFFSQSNRIQDPYQYDYTILLTAKPEENSPKTNDTSAPAAAMGTRPLAMPVEPKSKKVRHIFPDSPSRLPPTPAYDQAVSRLMIAEASRMAAELSLPETLPLTDEHAFVFLGPPAEFIHNFHLGRVETRDYVYGFSTGTTVSGVEYKHQLAVWDQIKAQYTWPISRLNTNAAIALANQILEAGGADVGALNRDCSVDITPSMVGGPHGRYFVPYYHVHWNLVRTNTLFDDLPDQTGAAVLRKLWPAQSSSGKMMAASLQFIEPTKQPWSYHVYDPKYIKKIPLETLDFVALLSQNGSSEAVLYEMKVATNRAALRELYIKLGAPLYIRQNLGLEPTNRATP